MASLTPWPLKCPLFLQPRCPTAACVHSPEVSPWKPAARLWVASTGGGANSPTASPTACVDSKEAVISGIGANTQVHNQRLHGRAGPVQQHKCRRAHTPLSLPAAAAPRLPRLQTPQSARLPGERSLAPPPPQTHRWAPAAPAAARCRRRPPPAAAASSCSAPGPAGRRWGSRSCHVIDGSQACDGWGGGGGGGGVGPAAVVQQAAAAAAKGGHPHLSTFRRLCTAQLIGGCKCCSDGPPSAWLRLSERRLLLGGVGRGATHLSDRSVHPEAFKLFRSPTPVRPSAA